MKPLALAFALALALPGVANAAAEPVWFEIGLRDPRTPQSYLLPLFDDELIEHARHRLAERDNGDPGPIEDGRSLIELVQPQAPTAEGTQASEVVASAELEFVDCNRARLRVALGSAQLQTPRPAAYLAQAALRWALIPTPDGQVRQGVFPALPGGIGCSTRTSNREKPFAPGTSPGRTATSSVPSILKSCEHFPRVGCQRKLGMWIWIGIGGAAAYVLARMREKDWDFEGEPRGGFHAGEAVQYAAHEMRMKQGVKLRVGVPVPVGVEFRIAREGLLSGLLRRVGVGREVNTGLANFDDTYEVQSEDSRLGPWLRDSEQARRAIGSLFGRRVNRLVAHRGHLWTEVLANKTGPQVDSTAAALAAMLQQLVAAAPPARPRHEIKAVSLWSRAWLPLLWTYGWVATAFVAFLGGSFDLVQYPATVNAFSWGKQVGLYALILSPVPIWLAARWMRDSIMARIVLTEFILVGTAGFVIGASVLAVRGNSELAWTPIETSQVRLLSQEARRRRGGPDYFLVFAPFTPGAKEPARVKVDAQLYRTARNSAQHPFELRWRIGAFGQPVVVDAPKPAS